MRAQEFIHRQLREDIENFPIANVRKANGAIGNQGVNIEQAADVLTHAAGMQVSSDMSMRQLVDALKADPAAQQRLRQFVQKNPVTVYALPDGSYHLQDGHHRTFLLNLLGDETVPAIVKEDVKEANTVEFEGLTLKVIKQGHELVVDALDDWGNKVLGHVKFNIGDGKELDPQDLRVDDKYQGQGIARVMYDYVKSLGYTINRSWDQTDAGAGFWDKHRGEDVRVWEQGVAEGKLIESAVFLNPTTVIVGQAHGQPLELSPNTLKQIQAIAAKHGAYYEGNGTDRAYTKGQIDRYIGSWDDEVAKTASPNDPKWVYVLFANVDANNRVQRVGIDPKDTIFNRLLATAKDNSFQGIGYTSQALQKFLQMSSEGQYDFVKMSQQPATQENLTRFLKAGEALMWPSNWEQYPNKAGKIAKAATVDVRDQYLATRKAGVYVTGSGHLKAVQNITGKQGVAEGSEQSLSFMVSRDQAERNEYQQFVKSQAGGDWTQGAKMYAQLKKRPANDIFDDASRLNQFMKMTFDFDKFTDKDWDNYWLLAQHCDDNRAFQKNALSIIKKYQGTDHSHYKYLYDRISMGLTGKQKYGTQNVKEQGVAEGMLDTLKVLALLGLGAYGINATLDSMNAPSKTPLGQALAVAAQHGDKSAAKYLANLDAYIEANDTGTLAMLKDSYLDGPKAAVKEANLHELNLRDPKYDYIDHGPWQIIASKQPVVMGSITGPNAKYVAKAILKKDSRKQHIGVGLTQNGAIEDVSAKAVDLNRASLDPDDYESYVIDFNVDFTREYMDPKTGHFFKFEKGDDGAPRLISAGPDWYAKFGKDMEQLGFRKASNKTGHKQESQIPTYSFPIGKPKVKELGLIPNVRYTVELDNQDADGNDVFTIHKHSRYTGVGTRMMMREPGFILAAIPKGKTENPPSQPVADIPPLDEAKYHGKTVKLGKPIRTNTGEGGKFKVYVKDPKTGNIKMVRFGDTTGLSIKRDDPKRRKSYRARHHCDNPGPRTKANYWSCRMWTRKPVGKILKGK